MVSLASHSAAAPLNNRVGMDHFGHGCLLQFVESLPHHSQPVSLQMADDHSGPIRLSRGWLFSGHHDEPLKVVAGATVECRIEGEFFRVVDVICHGD